tara:strand:- start:392 stop:1585 length:1194 start_codon:yes stop_codon:yes gene_type:complete
MERLYLINILMIIDKKNIYVWCPFISKVGTIQNVINTCHGLLKFPKSKSFNTSIINVFGEWDDYFTEIRLKKIEKKNLNSTPFIKHWKKEGFLKSRFCYILIFIFSFIPLLLLLRKKKPDYLIIHLITSLPIILFSIFNFKTKLILHIAGHPKMTFFRKCIWKIASSKITNVICPSNELKKSLLQKNIFDENKITVIQDPHLLVKEINNLKKEKIIDDFFDDSKILISIGRLTKQKNYFFLINNFNKLISKYKNVKLLIIGSGEMKNKLIKLINKLDIQNKVKLIDHEKNIYKYLIKSNYYISTSIWEGSSLAMIDAAHLGIPILCSNCPTGRKEFIGEDKRGFLYNEGSEIDFLNKFTEMYEMESKYIFKKMFHAKNESKNFTVFRNNLKLEKILF